jgi:TPR repeat protein
MHGDNTLTLRADLRSRLQREREVSTHRCGRLAEATLVATLAQGAMTNCRKLRGGILIVAIFISPGFAGLVAARSAQGVKPAPSKPAMTQELPHTMRFCGPAHCGTLTLNNGHYDAVYDDNAGTSTYAVQLFTPQVVQLFRTDNNGATAVLAGSISPQGNSIVDGKITWISINSGTFPFTLTWGNGTQSPPAAMQHPPAATSPPAMTSPTPPVNLELSGIWERSGGAAGAVTKLTQKILLVELGNDIEAVEIEGNPAVDDGADYLSGTVFTNGTIGGSVEERNAYGALGLTHEDLHFDDPNHLRVGDTIAFTRTSKLAVREETCDPSNPSHMSAPEALAIATIYVQRNTPEVGTCWFYIAAMQGNRSARESYAAALIFGTGVQKDLDQAFFWTQSLAMEGSYSAALNLAAFFGGGQGVPASAQRVKFWKARAGYLNPEVAHNASNPRPSWAVDTSPPCESSNPSHADKNLAFAHGRIAYEARAIAAAACWFQISADEGHVRAQVYLGIIYAFGFGLTPDPTRGFQIMYAAAKAHDLFAMMYLANFYRYGIGTPIDMNQGYALVSAVVQADGGPDVYTQVQGTQMSLASALGALANMLPTISAGSQSCENTSRYPTEAEVDQYRACQAASAGAPATILGQLATANPAHHTVETPEEIFPEYLQW